MKAKGRKGRTEKDGGRVGRKAVREGRIEKGNDGDEGRREGKEGW